VDALLPSRRLDIADIVRSHRQQLEQQHRLNSRQKRVLTDIAQCRTEALGGHVEHCSQCDYEQTIYRSCRNRHCPKCQALAQEEWINAQRQRMLDVKHFHVVFTLPMQLRPLAIFAPRVLYDALLSAAGRTLRVFGQSRLDATIGATLVLHTWKRDLQLHPHVHAIVTAGGLSSDGSSFKHSGRKYLFPNEALASVFRAKILDRLWTAYRTNAFHRFDDFQDPEGFQRLINSLPKRWRVYTKPSFDNGDYVLNYLGRYTHRVAIANSRLLHISANTVTFRTKGGATQTLRCVDFLHRFTQHVLPVGFHKIRHIGLNASRDKRDRARALLQRPLQPLPSRSFRQWLQLLTGRDVCLCPKCLVPVTCTALPRPRAPPSSPQAPLAA
jgi:hypothetical protein